MHKWLFLAVLLGSPGSYTASGNMNLVGNAAVLVNNDKDLTESSATGFARLEVASNDHHAGFLIYSVHADDGSQFQTRNGMASFAISNENGTEDCAINKSGSEAVVASGGTITVTLSCASNVDGTVDLLVNAVASINQTTLHLHYQLLLCDDYEVTPL